MQRPLGFFETYSKAGYDLLARDGIVVTMATLEGELEADHLHQALDWLQRRHPLLQAHLAVDEQNRDVMDTQAYASASPAERLARIPLKMVDRTHDASAQAAFREESAAPIEAWSAYLWRLVWVRGTDRHEWILISRHEITDATSTTCMLRDLLVLTDLCSRGETQHPLFEPLPLLDSVEQLLPLRFRIGPVGETAAMVEPSATWPYEGFAEPKDREGVYEFSTLDAAFMARLRSKCKERGLTINSALSAAFFMAEYRQFQRGADVHVTYRTAISLRNRCEPAIGNEHLGTFAMTVATTFGQLAKTSFWDFAGEVGQVLNAEIQAMERKGFLPDSFDKEEVFQATRDAYALTSTQYIFSDGPWISNLGLLPFEDSYGALRLTGMYFGTRQVAGDAGAVLSIITLHGQMFCCLTTAAPLMSSTTAHNLLKDFEALLRKACE